MVTTALSGPSPDGAPLFYQKHMTHHMLPEIKTDFMALCRNAFLIRSPAAVIASYAARRETVALEDIGVVRQAELFDEEADRLGHAPPVLDGAEVLENPEGLLRALCAALGIDFLPVMLSWPPGRRASDGVWAPAWYDQVERSTGFVRPTLVAGAPPALSAPLSRLAEAAQPFYDRLAPWRLRPLDGSGNGAAA
jgi:hypothetical protein